MDSTKVLVSHIIKEKIAFGACVALFLGLIFSKFLITIAMIVLLLVGVVHAIDTKQIARLWQNKTYLSTIGVFLLITISALFSNNLAEGWIRIRIALPLLVLPIAFAWAPSFSKRRYQQLLYLYILAMTIACIGVLVNYYLHFDAMQERLKTSGAIPTPNKDHIRFSLMINLAVFAATWLCLNKFHWKTKVEKWLLYGIIIFLIATIHILSVRIGLVVLYIGIGLSILYFIVKQKRYLLGAALFLIALPMPYLAVNYIPSIKTKYELTVYNIQLFNRGEIGQFSDTQRLLSYQIAMEVASSSPWLGVGIGDLYDEQEKIYAKDYSNQKVMYPHNMFLTIYAATGIIGLLLFSILFMSPLFFNQQYKNYFFVLFFCTIFLSFMTENTLLMAIGVGIYTFFLSLTANYLEGERE